MAIPLISIVGMNRDGWVINSLSMILLGASFNCEREKVKVIVPLLLLLGIIRVLLGKFKSSYNLRCKKKRKEERKK